MMPQLILAALGLTPLLVLTLLRVNAVLVFFSVCLGDVLVRFVAPDANDFMQMFSLTARPPGSPLTASAQTLDLVLLFLPVVLATIFLIRSVKTKGKLALNVIPALGCGFLLVLLAVPLLPGDTSRTVMGSPVWAEIGKFQDIVIGASALVCLFALWAQRPKHHDEKHGKHA